MAEALVSVIVNNHNYGRFVGAAIHSALVQDWPELEVIVVDDGSTDDSAEVIGGFGERVRAIFKPNGGQGSAFNAGFRASRGIVVNFLDADDLLHPSAARRAVAAFKDPRVVQWMTPLAQIDGDGQPTGRLFPAAPLPSGDLCRRVLEFGPWSYQTVPNTGNFWARPYLERVLPIPESRYRIGGDEYLSAIAALYGRIASDPEPCGCYRGHGGNAYWRGRLSVQDVADDVFYFERIATLLVEHAGRLGLDADPAAWLRRDWRQHVRRLVLHRAGRLDQPPEGSRMLEAALHDQTTPWKKLLLLPAVALLLSLPQQAAVPLALRMLRRS